MSFSEEQKQQIEAVRREYRPTMTLEIVHAWAVDAIAALDHLTKANEELRAEVELAKQEGVTETLQQIDCLTGGDGEYRLSTCPDRNCPDEDAMCKKIVARFDDLRATIDRLQTTIKAFNNGMPAMTTKEVADENADLCATIDRLTKERDEARAQFDNHVVWASGQAAELEAKVARLTKGRDSFAASYTHAAEERDEARTRLSAMQEGIDEAVRRADTETPFKTHVIVSDVVEPLRPFATKPEPEVDPLAPALKEADSKTTSDDREYIDMARELRTALAARGGRVVFDGREG